VHLENLEALTRVLQASISPVALVSGVGLLILSQTNRFSIVTDRLRRLALIREEQKSNDPKASRQIAILLQRARILRYAISAALFCVLLASILVLLIFAAAAFDLHALAMILLLFGLSLVSLIISLVLFLWDMHLSLKAVEEMLRD
jgi:Protein of unknown function (DUF2721)